MVAPAVPNPGQLIQIEVVHRGFLCHHLFGVNCVLLAASAGVTSIRLSVKRRGTSLFHSADAVDRFGECFVGHLNTGIGVCRRTRTRVMR